MMEPERTDGLKISLHPQVTSDGVALFVFAQSQALEAVREFGVTVYIRQAVVAKPGPFTLVGSRTFTVDRNGAEAEMGAYRFMWHDRPALYGGLGDVLSRDPLIVDPKAVDDAILIIVELALPGIEPELNGYRLTAAGPIVPVDRQHWAAIRQLVPSVNGVPLRNK